MSHTGLSPYTPDRKRAMAHGYALVDVHGQPAGGSARSSRPGATRLRDMSSVPQIASPSGGAFSTVGDLLRFAQALTRLTLLTPAMTTQVLTPRVNAPQPGGPPTDKYTYGFAYQAVNGVTFVGHDGGTPGYEGQIDIYPASGYVVIILTNQDQTTIPAIQATESILTRG